MSTDPLISCFKQGYGQSRGTLHCLGSFHPVCIQSTTHPHSHCIPCQGSLLVLCSIASQHKGSSWMQHQLSVQGQSRGSDHKETYLQINYFKVEWFSTMCRETKTKAITPISHKRQRQLIEPIRNCRNYSRVRTLFLTKNSRTFQGLSRTHFFHFLRTQEGQNQAHIMPHQMLKVESAPIFVSDTWEA